MRRAAKIDNNQADIVELYKSVGCLVKSAAAMGEGFPDLVVQYNGLIYLVEVKNPEWGGKLTKKQRDFISQGWDVHVVTDTYSALHVLGLKEKGK
jgi:hypothetical protein